MLFWEFDHLWSALLPMPDLPRKSGSSSSFGGLSSSSSTPSSSVRASSSSTSASVHAQPPPSNPSRKRVTLGNFDLIVLHTYSHLDEMEQMSKLPRPSYDGISLPVI